MTCRYTMIANKADDRAIPRVCSFNRKSVGARIWDILLKKDALVRDRRSIATIARMQCGAGKVNRYFCFCTPTSCLLSP